MEASMKTLFRAPQTRCLATRSPPLASVLPARQKARTSHRLKAATLEPITLDSLKELTSAGTSSASQEAPQNATEQEAYDWAGQWYPMAYVQDLDPKKPHAVELLGQRLVLWRDAEAQWRCFEDKCPHRLAPLSEGRIEPSDGTLMCSYHGWRFDGEGACTDVPQSIDARANAAACASPRSCAKPHPTQVAQGKVWVFGEGGPQAFIRAAAVKPALIEELQGGFPPRAAGGEEWVFFGAEYARDLPYGWATLVENALDPSHLGFSHHGVIGDRREPQEMRIEPEEAPASAPSPKDSFSMAVSNYDHFARKNVTYSVQFVPPCLVRWGAEPFQGDEGGVMPLYTVPTGPGRCRVLFSILLPKTAIPAHLRALFALMPRWAKHLNITGRVLDGDSMLLHAQEKIVLKEEAEAGPKAWNKLYYMPAQADRLVVAYRQWLAGRGAGGPVPLTEDSAWLPKKEILDSYVQHTQHCSACSKAVKVVTALQYVAAALCALCMLGLATALGAGSQPLAAVPAALAAGACAFLGLCIGLGGLRQRFHYTPYEHAHT